MSFFPLSLLLLHPIVPSPFSIYPHSTHSSKTHIPPLQSPRHHLPVVPEPAESHPLPGVQPLQVADHQDRAGPAAAHHAGPLPLQHAGLPCQKTAGGLRGCWEDREGGGQLKRWRDGWVDGGMGESQRVDTGSIYSKWEVYEESHPQEGRQMGGKALWKFKRIISPLLSILILMYSLPPSTLALRKEAGTTWKDPSHEKHWLCNPVSNLQQA